MKIVGYNPPSLQRAVLRDSGISPAETAVRIWKLLPRTSVSEAATSQSRWDVMRNRRQSAVENDVKN